MCSMPSNSSDSSLPQFMILDSIDLSVLGRGKASDHSIVAVKISPNGSIFACAASNFKIYVHNFNSKDFELSAVSEMHNGVITALDFSVDSMYLRGISTTFECISCKIFNWFNSLPKCKQLFLTFRLICIFRRCRKWRSCIH